MSRPAVGPSYLAIDLGASSGRAVVGTLSGASMATREVHRFRTPLIERGRHLTWDIDILWREIKVALTAALEFAPALRSVSIDSWAVDYVPLDAAGSALRHPYAYRDGRTKGRLATATTLVGGADALYGTTGIQFLEINTLPQVVADLEDEPELVARTASRLLIAEYFMYRLSGQMVAERTMASTTQLMDARRRVWARELIRAIGDEPSRWPRIVPPGTVLGPVTHALLPTGLPTGHPTGAGEAPLVLASCAHDTAAAVAAVPASGVGNWAYISSGTWSLVGVELDAPILSAAARQAGFTNEAGLDDTIRFLKNRMGMWVLEECCREWADEGERPSYDALMAAAAAAPSSGQTLDLDDATFAERGGMTAKLMNATRARGIVLTAGRGALVRLIIESLAASYARTIAELETLTGRRIEVVHVVGGGALNDLLDQLTADACERRVLAGPDEATVLGNLLVQARTLGDLPRGVSVREAARQSATLTEYTPRKVGPVGPVGPMAPIAATASSALRSRNSTH
jgi:rhamnulokinase